MQTVRAGGRPTGLWAAAPPPQGRACTAASAARTPRATRRGGCTGPQTQPFVGLLGWEGRSLPGRSCGFQPPSAVSPETVGAAEAATAALDVVLPHSLAHTIAVVLGYLVILGSLTVKVPQIVRILKAKSAEGLSFVGHIAETFVYIVNFSYNVRFGYPFSQYGDAVACAIQNVVLMFLIAQHRAIGKLRMALGGVAVATVCFFLLSPSGCSTEALAALQASTLAVMVFGARVPQIVLNFRRGNTGELSLITQILLVAGNLARLYTSIVLTGDRLLIFFAVAAATCNLTLLAQVVGTLRRKQSGAAPVSDATKVGDGDLGAAPRAAVTRGGDTSAQLKCDRKWVGSVIGPGGSVISKLEAASGATISVVEGSDPAVIEISGSGPAVTKAKADVEALIREAEDPDYEGPKGRKLRAKADEFSRKMEECAKEKDALFDKGDKSGGHAKLEEVKEWQRKMHEANTEAAAAIFDHRNNGKGERCMDFHGLRKQEALDILEERLQRLSGGELELIPGAGNHSDGAAVLKPAIAQLLKAKGLSFEEKNAGTLVVKL